MNLKFYFLFFFYSLFSFANAVETESDKIDFDMTTGLCELSGNAKVVFYQNNKKHTFKSDKITIYCEEQNLDKPKRIIANGKVSFFNDEFNITSKTCEYDMKTIEFKDGVEIKSKELGKINADSARYNTDTKKIDIQSKNKVKLIVSDKKSKQIQKKMKR